MFKYSSIFINSALYVPSICKRPLPPLFFFTLPTHALLFYICRSPTLFSVAECQRTLNIDLGIAYAFLSFLNWIR